MTNSRLLPGFAILQIVLAALFAGPLVAQDDTTIEGTVVAEKASEAILVVPSEEAAKAFAKPAPQSIDDLRLIEEHVEKLVAQLEPSVVAVRIGNAQGSGVIVSKDGYVLTAAHVSGKPGRSATFILRDGRRVTGKTLGRNSAIDAGLMKIESDEDWPFTEMADIRDVDAGDWSVAMGHPGGFQNGRPPVVRLGRIVSKRRTVLQTDNALVGGDSGGPLFDTSGRVIGIHSRIGPSITWNFHVPIDAYTGDWDKLADSSEWGGGPEQSRTVLGVNGEDHAEGALITGVPDAFPAKKAGIEVGDVVTAVDGTPITEFSDLTEAISDQKPGDEVTLTVKRAGKTLKFKVKLGDRES